MTKTEESAGYKRANLCIIISPYTIYNDEKDGCGGIDVRII